MVTAATPSVIRTGRRDKADVSRFSRSASITKSFFSMGLDLYSGTSRLFYDRRVRFREPAFSRKEGLAVGKVKKILERGISREFRIYSSSNHFP